MLIHLIWGLEQSSSFWENGRHESLFFFLMLDLSALSETGFLFLGS
uniref:Uncharacterized protein n=1 Tax=Rhizophora mucronata TaxID=61149 RepID=A0A2P2N609_RHIMU